MLDLHRPDIDFVALASGLGVTATRPRPRRSSPSNSAILRRARPHPDRGTRTTALLARLRALAVSAECGSSLALPRRLRGNTPSTSRNERVCTLPVDGGGRLPSWTEARSVALESRPVKRGDGNFVLSVRQTERRPRRPSGGSTSLPAWRCVRGPADDDPVRLPPGLALRTWPFFVHERIGAGGRLIPIPKLRTLAPTTIGMQTRPRWR